MQMCASSFLLVLFMQYNETSITLPKQKVITNTKMYVYTAVYTSLFLNFHHKVHINISQTLQF